MDGGDCPQENNRVPTNPLDSAWQLIHTSLKETKLAFRPVEDRAMHREINPSHLDGYRHVGVITNKDGTSTAVHAFVHTYITNGVPTSWTIILAACTGDDESTKRRWVSCFARAGATQILFQEWHIPPGMDMGRFLLATATDTSLSEVMRYIQPHQLSAAILRLLDHDNI